MVLGISDFRPFDAFRLLRAGRLGGETELNDPPQKRCRRFTIRSQQNHPAMLRLMQDFLKKEREKPILKKDEPGILCAAPAATANCKPSSGHHDDDSRRHRRTR